jgi:hypothetical protein
VRSPIRDSASAPSTAEFLCSRVKVLKHLRALAFIRGESPWIKIIRSRHSYLIERTNRSA